jgi:transcriptional regulator with XRE-family HTH domain
MRQDSGRSGQMNGDHPPGPGDLGRRIAARRRRLGWSRAELAAKAGLSVAYLTYLETRPSLVTMTCLIELADALETTTDALLGAGSAVPAGAAAYPCFDDLWAADVRTGRRGERPGPFLG